MRKFLELATHIAQLPIDDDVVELASLTPMQRDMIVAALRGADALRALASLPPKHPDHSPKEFWTLGQQP